MIPDDDVREANEYDLLEDDSQPAEKNGVDVGGGFGNIGELGACALGNFGASPLGNRSEFSAGLNFFDDPTLDLDSGRAAPPSPSYFVDVDEEDLAEELGEDVVATSLDDPAFANENYFHRAFSAHTPQRSIGDFVSDSSSVMGEEGMVGPNSNVFQEFPKKFSRSFPRNVQNFPKGFQTFPRSSPRFQNVSHKFPKQLPEVSQEIPGIHLKVS